MSKPSDFFMGVLDFFAILLPGAISTAILAPRLGCYLLGPLVSVPTSEAENWAAFLICTYFIGHLIFLVGSNVDRLCDSLRERLSPCENEEAYQCAKLIRNSLINVSERKALKTFQWSRSVLIAKCPAAAEDVHRLEADSKFFRSLIVVCALASLVFLASGRFVEGIVALALILPCFVRYYERRIKSNTQAYIHVITLYRLGTVSAPSNQDIG